MRNKAGAKGFYLCPLTGRTSTTKTEGWEWWDSHLERKVHDYLIASFPGIQRQWTVRLIESAVGIPARTYKCDFFLPEIETLLEVKGEWINQKGFSYEKRRFIDTVMLCHHAGHKLVTVGDTAFKIGKYTVHNYKDISSWLQ